MARTEAISAYAAVALSGLTLLSTSIWSRQANRDDELRSERRVEYSTFLASVQRCVGPVYQLSANLERAEAIANPASISRLLEELSEDPFGCTAELNSSANKITLLAGEGAVLRSALDLNSEASTARAAGETYAAILGASDEPVEAAQVTFLNLCVQSPFDDPPSDQSVLGDLEYCLAEIEDPYDSFVEAARADVQERAPGVVDGVRRFWWVWFIGALTAAAAWLVLRRFNQGTTPIDGSSGEVQTGHQPAPTKADE